MKILVNTITAKKHAGGAFQISQNFMLKSLEDKSVEWYYITSQDLDDIIGSHFMSMKDSQYFVFPTQPDFKHTYKSVKAKLEELENKLNPDVVYSITAPSYFRFKAPEVMRFTNPWVTHPNKYAWSLLSWKEKIYYYLYNLNQKRMIKKAHYFITQTETCAKGIQYITGVPKSRIKVISNVLPAIFNTLDNTPVLRGDFVNIACVGAATVHKNFDLIPDVLKTFKEQGYGNIRMHVTLPYDDPILLKIQKKLQIYGLSDMLINHGRLLQNELGEMYRGCQFCYLPTLLEVFSASVLEAMYYGLPIVASNFEFNSEILEDSCLYYEPKNAIDAVNKFIMLMKNLKLQDSCRKKMEYRLLKYGDYNAHFNAIKEFLLQVGNKIV